MLKHDSPDALSGFTFIDLFAGIGGFRYAMGSFGAECVFSSEWDKHAAAAYEENHGEKPFGDITKIAAKDIPKMDAICGGFPCQAFSISGNQKGFDDVRGTLFFDIIRIAEFHRPKILFLENVRNLETHDGGKTISTIHDHITRLGYKFHCQVLSASNYGIPHARERIFIIGIRNDIDPGLFHFPPPPNADVALEDVLLPESETLKYRIDMSKFKHKYFGIPTSRALIPIRIGQIKKGRQGERIYHPKGHAITLSSGGGGIGAKTGMYMTRENVVRRLAPRECARLMGLPETFKLVSDNQTYRQMGNGVVIDVLQHIILSLLEQVDLWQHQQSEHVRTE